jgi:LmbE family N-acetylglucosaminyl deacetylase
MQAHGPILGVWAHPDDEVYLSGGIMADAVARDERVVVAMATRGEAGTSDPATWPPERLAPVRERELEEALDVLGVTELRWLGYPDGGCADADEYEAVGRLEELLSEISPAVVLTFGPDGMTGHPDHVAVSRWTSAAFARVGRRDALLLFATLTQRYVDEFAEMVADPAIFLGNEPPVVPDDEVVLEFEVNDGLLDVKRKAILSHASQVEPFLDTIGIDLILAANRKEYFRNSGITPR